MLAMQIPGNAITALTMTANSDAQVAALSNEDGTPQDQDQVDMLEALCRLMARNDHTLALLVSGEIVRHEKTN